MTLAELLARSALADRKREVLRLLDVLPATAPADWRQLAAVLAVRGCGGGGGWGSRSGARVLAVGGGQGAGKTTLSRLLAGALAELGVRSEVLSLDDFYLPRAERETLATTVHPLLATRGVPGTHDTARLGRALEALRTGRGVSRPQFDKAVDDRVGEVRIDAGVGAVIFEGWCVGALPQPAAALLTPCNELERREDATGRWRGFVNERLGRDYTPLWELADELLFLQVPDMAAVRRWRGEQEAQLAERDRMGAAALDRFVQHYERLTRWMLATLPQHAEMVGLLDEHHGLADLSLR
jgi:D-glycerate 3-kinase